MKAVKEIVKKEAIEVWKQGVKSHRKLEVYYNIKKEWGMEEYLRDPSDIGSNGKI